MGAIILLTPSLAPSSVVIASEKKAMLCALAGTSVPNLRALAGSLSLTLSCRGGRGRGDARLEWPLANLPRGLELF